MGCRIRLKTKNMMWNWATLGLIHSNTTWSKMWELGFARIGKLFEKMQTSSFGSDFSTHELLAKCNLETWFLPIQSSDFFCSQKFWSFFDKPFKKFCENMLIYRKFNIFAILGVKFNNSFMKRNGNRTLIQRIFMDKLTQIHQNFKIPNIPNHKFLMINSSG